MSRSLRLLTACCMLLGFGLPISASAQDETICYAVGDGGLPPPASDGSNSTATDHLVTVVKTNGVETFIGDAGVSNIEAIEFWPNNQTLFAADADELGTLNISDGLFTALPNQFTPNGEEAQGPLGEIDVTDIDGLSFDFTDIANGFPLYGSVRRSGGGVNDLLVQIDTNTGEIVRQVWGTNDYLVIPNTIEVVPDGNGGFDTNILADIDDIAIDPISGILWAIQNLGGVSDHLVQIDKDTGAVTDIGSLSIDDAEGLSFFVDGSLFVSTGSAGPDATDNSLYDLDFSTGAASNNRSLSLSDDYEGLSCSTKVLSGVDVQFTLGATNCLCVGSVVTGEMCVVNSGTAALLNLSVTNNYGAPFVSNLTLAVGASTCFPVSVTVTADRDLCAGASATDVFGTAVSNETCVAIDVDTTAPVITTCPSNMTFECVSNVPDANTNSVVATDDCSPTVTITHLGDVSDGQSCPQTITRTYVVADDCNNSNTCVQVFTIDDTTPPQFLNIPTNVTVECSAIPAAPTIIAQDNCLGAVSVSLSTNIISGACAGTYTLERIWTGVDVCTNSIMATQTITVVDTTPPVIDTCASNITVQCIGDVPLANTNLVSGTDDCGTVAVSWGGDVSDNGSCPETITRTYTLTDDCGNATNCTVSITIDDTIAPTLIGVPTNITVQCDSIPSFAVVTASDNCATNLTVIPSSNTIPGSCVGEYTLERIWSVSDDCNNSSVATQTITVVDTTPPVIDTCASNITVQCIADVPVADTNLVSGTDNCGTVSVSWLGDLSDSNSCPQTITRTYQLSDECGNITNCTVSIV